MGDEGEFARHTIAGLIRAIVACDEAIIDALADGRRAGERARVNQDRRARAQTEILRRHAEGVADDGVE